MLKAYDTQDNNITHPINIEDTAWYVTHKYNGYDTLTVEMSSTNEVYEHILEETRIVDSNNRYIVKNIDEHSGVVVIDCDLDTDDWRENFWHDFRRTDSTLQQVLDYIKPAGWRTDGAQSITVRETIESSEGKGLENVTPEDILIKAMEVYGVIVRFDVKGKILYIIDPKKFVASGDYFTDELNLKSIGFVGNSKDFATRLFAYGKKDESGNPLTFATINGGLQYVSNNQYSDRVIYAGWSDERYTVPESLLEDARKKLDTLSFPMRSYECDVVSLDKNTYMHKVIALIDRRRKTRVDHRVIEYKEYPKAHILDKVVLSAVPPKIEGSIKSLKADIKEQGTKAAQVASDIALASMSMITGVSGGNIMIRMVRGVPKEILVMDADKSEMARNIIRLGENGIESSTGGIAGEYRPVLAIDGKRITKHSDGSWTLTDEDGMRRCTVSGEKDYHYLHHYGSVEFMPDEEPGVFKTEIAIQLKEEFRHKDIAVHLSIKELIPAAELDVLHSLKTAWNYNKESGVLSIYADCKMVNIKDVLVTTPKLLAVAYSIIA